MARNKRRFGEFCENGVTNEAIRSKRTCVQSVRENSEQHPQIPVHGGPLVTDTIDSPAVWAKRRHALCETLPYFAAYNGSLYSNNKIAKGFLIDKEARTRDHLGGRVIVTTL
jgi:hypothetical protein